MVIRYGDASDELCLLPDSSEEGSHEFTSARASEVRAGNEPGIFRLIVSFAPSVSWATRPHQARASRQDPRMLGGSVPQTPMQQVPGEGEPDYAHKCQRDECVTDPAQHPPTRLVPRPEGVVKSHERS